MDIQELIEQYTNYKSQYALEQAEYERQRDAILDKVRAELDALGAEFNPRLTFASDNVKALEDSIKAQVLELGQSIKGRRWQFVYSKPRVTWDSNMLSGMMIVVPELAKARKEGEASVSVREVK